MMTFDISIFVPRGKWIVIVQATAVPSTILEMDAFIPALKIDFPDFDPYFLEVVNNYSYYTSKANDIAKKFHTSEIMAHKYINIIIYIIYINQY